MEERSFITSRSGRTAKCEAVGRSRTVSKKSEPVVMGLWVPKHRVSYFEENGYVKSQPQPKLSDQRKKFYADDVHMVKKVPK